MSQSEHLACGCQPGEIPAQKVHTALQLLVEACDYARDTQCDRWEFAVEISALRAAGLSRNDLRWLLRKGYVEHARETTAAASVNRQFQRLSNHTFFKRSCFILTDAGMCFASQNGNGDSPSDDLPETFHRPSHEGNGQPRPRWDAKLREFYVGDQLVKRYRSPAPNQIAILAAFEEEGWPRHIDDPLPGNGNLEEDPKRRLNDTVKALNRHQLAPLIHFSTDGTGEGVRWRRAVRAVNTESSGRLHY